MPESQESQPQELQVEPGRKRVRAVVGGQVVADTIRPTLVWEKPYYPTYFLPEEDVTAKLTDTGRREQSKAGEAHVHDVEVDGRALPGAARTFPDAPVEDLRGLVRLDWDAVDQWFEEDEPVFVHPRDPHHRVDILASSRRVQVEVDGVTVADSTQLRILFETGLPPRYYLPLTDVRLDLLRPSDTRTSCPYKGDAAYWSIEVDGRTHADLVWTYRTPLPESQKIAGFAAFYDEKVDVTVDGVRQDRPTTPFS